MLPWSAIYRPPCMRSSSGILAHSWTAEFQVCCLSWELVLNSFQLTNRFCVVLWHLCPKSDWKHLRKGPRGNGENIETLQLCWSPGSSSFHLKLVAQGRMTTCRTESNTRFTGFLRWDALRCFPAKCWELLASAFLLKMSFHFHQDSIVILQFPRVQP